MTLKNQNNTQKLELNTNELFYVKSIVDMIEYDKELCDNAIKVTDEKERFDILRKLYKRLDSEHRMLKLFVNHVEITGDNK